MSKEHLYQVCLIHKKTGKRLNLQVWAQNSDEATHKQTGSLIGYHCQYDWRGTSVLHENNRPISRDLSK